MSTFPAPVVPGPTRIQIALWAFILLLMLTLSLYDWNGYQVGTYGDDGSYVTNADSLVQRVPYGTLLTPDRDRVSQFPFLLPLLLAPLRALFPQSLDVLRVIPLVSTLLLLTVLFWGWAWLGRGLSYWWALAVVALTALSPITILHARTVMSEAPFFLFSLLMMVLLEKIIAKPPRAWGIWLGVLMVCVMYTRTIGWIFVATWLAYLLWKKGRGILPQVAVAIGTTALLLGIVLLTTTVRPLDLLPQEYLAQFSNYVGRGNAVRLADRDVIPVGVSRRNFVESVLFSVVVHLDFADKLPFQMERAVIQWTNSTGLVFLRYLPGVVGVVLVCLGAVLWWRKTGITAFQIIVLPYLGLLFFWPWNGARLFYPIQSHLILAALFGIFGIAHWTLVRLRMRAPAPRLAGQLVAVTVLVIAAASVWLDVRFTRTMLLPSDQIVRASQLNATIPTDAVVLSTRAVTDHLYLDRMFIDVPTRFASTAELVQMMQRLRVSYIVTHYGLKAPGDTVHLRIGTVNRFVTALEPLVQANVLELKFVDEPNDMAIYRVRADALAAFQP